MLLFCFYVLFLMEYIELSIDDFKIKKVHFITIIHFNYVLQKMNKFGENP